MHATSTYMDRLSDLAIRFWACVEKSPGCWKWNGYRVHGYGAFYAPGNELVLAHRFSYELHREAIPRGLVIDHLCRNPECTNPEHLEVVSTRTNVLRGVGITARQAQQTHCKRGHELSGSNLWVRRSGARQCRACHNERTRARKSVAVAAGLCCDCGTGPLATKNYCTECQLRRRTAAAAAREDRG